MSKVNDITAHIEKLVEEGRVEPGDVIKIPDIPRDLVVPLRTSLSRDRNYKIERETVINPNNPYQETYTLYLKYLGGNHA